MNTTAGQRTGVELALSMVTHRNTQQANHDVIGAQGWVFYAETSALSVRLPLRDGSPLRVAVTDGHDTAGGGRPARTAAEVLTRPVRGPDGRSRVAGTALAELLEQAFFDADEAIRADGGGCAAAAVVLGVDGHAVVSNVGDVHVFRMVQGYAGQLTRPGVPMPELGALTAAGGRVELPRYEFRALPGDRLVISTGGLRPADVRAVSGQDGSRAAEWLLHAALHAGARANVTVAVIDVVVVNLKPSAPAVSPAAAPPLPALRSTPEPPALMPGERALGGVA